MGGAMMENKVVVIDSVREVYGVDSFLGDRPDKWTMKVSDLIALLEDLDPDARVVLSHDNGYTFGSLWFDRIREAVADPVTSELDYEFA